MKVIKVFFTTLILVAALVFLIAPPLVGLWVKAKYTNIIAQINKNNSNITAKISHYNFGWFSSKVTIKVDLHLRQPEANTNNQTTKDENIRLNGVVDIHHGPVIYVKKQNSPDFYLAWASAKAHIPTLKFTTHTVWNFNDTLVSQFSSPAFKIVQGGATISLDKLKGTSTYHLDSHQLKLNLAITSFDISNLIKVNNLTYTTNVDRERHINYGTQRLDISKITLNTEENNTITFNHFSATSNTALNGGKIDMTVNYTIRSISKNALGINGAQLDFSVKNVDAKSLNILLAKLQTQEKGIATQTTTNYNNLIEPGMNLLRHGLSVQIITMQLQTDNGPVIIDGTFTIPKLDKNTTLVQLPTRVKANFNFQAPKVWLKQQMAFFISFFKPQQNQTQDLDPEAVATDTLQQWEKNQVLISSGNSFKARIQFNNGQLLINDKVPTITKPKPQDDEVIPSTPDTTTPQKPDLDKDSLPDDPSISKPNPLPDDSKLAPIPKGVTPTVPQVVTPQKNKKTTTPEKTSPDSDPAMPPNKPVSPDDPMLKKIPPTEPVDRCMPRPKGERI